MPTQPTQRPTLLITRPIVAARSFACEVEAVMPGRWQILLSPLMEVRHRNSPPLIETGETLIFTSRNGVAAFLAQGVKTDTPVLCVGERTTAYAANHGLHATCAGRTAAELIATVRDTSDTEGQTYLHLRGAHVATDLETALSAAGRPTRSHVLYDQIALPLTADARDALVEGDTTVPIFSARSARLLGAALASHPLPAPSRLVCLSAAVAREARRFHTGPIDICATPDVASMLVKIAAISGK
jgi:uroporphyrinogen-III synthase